MDAGLDKDGIRTFWISNCTPIEVEILLDGHEVEIEEIDFTSATASDETKETVKRLLTTDALEEAEKATGKSYKTDKATESLGFRMFMSLGKKRSHLLSILGDTTFHEDSETYIEKIESYGFIKVYEEEFDSQSKYDKEATKEKYYIYWHKGYSFLLDWDTYRGNRNGANLYYNVLLPRNRSGITSSGSYEDFGLTKEGIKLEPPKYLQKEPRHKNFHGDIAWGRWLAASSKFNAAYEKWFDKNNLFNLWKGNHDAREALLHNITRLTTEAIPVKKWVKNEIFSLTNHMDWKNGKGNIDERSTGRFNALPKYVRDAIGEPDFLKK